MRHKLIRLVLAVVGVAASAEPAQADPPCPMYITNGSDECFFEQMQAPNLGRYRCGSDPYYFIWRACNY